MGATPAEFSRGLRLAHPGFEEAGVDAFRLEEGGVRLRIRLARGPSRRLGRFDLPVLRVSYDFEAGKSEDCRALLARLDLAMQRGGG